MGSLFRTIYTRLYPLFRFIHSKFHPPSLPPSATFAGQTILITGATSGLGLEAAIHYVHLGASTVIITGRTLARAIGARDAIEARTGTQGKGILQARELDMDTFAGVTGFVSALRTEVKSVDVVLLNAGVYKRTYDLSPEAWEETLQVNTLSTVLLGLLLLPWMREARPEGGGIQHLGFVSSGLHTMVDISGPDFPKEGVLRYWNDEESFKASRGNYGLSKLFMMYGVGEMVKIASGEDGIPSPIINTMCPGICKSDLARQHAARGILVKIIMAVFYNIFAKSTEAGARTLVLAAMTGPDEHGKYIRHYGTDEDYREKASRNITNSAGKKLGEQVYGEMLEIFEHATPEASKIAHSKL